jgi:hypothetical protein
MIALISESLTFAFCRPILNRLIGDGLKYVSTIEKTSDILVNEIKTETKIIIFLLTKTETKTKNNCETKTK